MWGDMPITKALPYEWYDTPNIHQCTIKDFVRLCDKLGVTIERSIALKRNNEVRRVASSPFLSNLMGEQALFLLSKPKR
jgi:methionine biosynthesis protein MetW